MQGLCCLSDDTPGPLHSFKFRYTDDICSFLLVAHSLADAQLFTSKFVNIEEVVPLDKSSNNYIVGRKMPLEEGGGFQATFDLGLMVRND